MKNTQLLIISVPNSPAR